MALFKKKMSDKDFKMMLENEAREQREAMLNMNTLNLPNNNSVRKAPLVLTPEELLGNETAKPQTSNSNVAESIDMTSNPPSTEDFLFKKMLEAREESTKKATTPPPQPEPVKQEPVEVKKEEPAYYELESVEEILKRMEEKANQKVNSIYGYPTKEEPVKATSSVEETVSSALNDILGEVKEPVKEEVKEEVKKDFNVESLIDDMKADIGIFENDKDAKEVLSESFTEQKVEVKEEEPVILEPTVEMPKVEEIKVETPLDDNLQQENQVNIDIISDDGFVDAEEIAPAEELDKTNIFTSVKEDEYEDISSNYEDDEDEEDEEEFDEYNSLEDKEKTLKFINKGKIFSIFSLLIGAASLIFAALGSYLMPENSATFILVSSVLLGLAFVLNINLLKALGRIFTGKFSPDSTVAGVTLLSVIYNFMTIYLPNLKLIPLFLATTIPLVITEIVRLLRYGRINKSFRLIGNDDTKNALVFAESKTAKAEAAKLANFEDANVCLKKKTKNLVGFIKHTFTKESSGFTVGVVSLFGIAFAIAAAVIAYLNETISPISCFMAVMLICATPVTLLITELPLKLANSKLKFYNSAIFGEKTADVLDGTNCINIDIADVFPEGTVKLIDFKLLSPNPIDQTLLDAAALTKVAKSPLAGIFKQITDETEEQKELPVDTVVYEERMGISGWVDNRRVFVGNRTLMEAHGFRVPSLEVDRKVLQRGYFPVYLGTENVLCALLIVKYTAHPEVALELKRLASTGTSILINNCDQNVTGEMVEDYLGLFEDTVYITTRSLQKSLDKESEEVDTVNSAAVVGDNVCGLASTITAAIKVKKLSKAMLVLYVILTICLMAGVVAAIFLKAFNLISALSISVALVASLLIEVLPPYISRP